MKLSERIAREDALSDALRAANDAIGDARPHAQALKIIEAIKRIRSDAPVVVATERPTDFLAMVQAKARMAWREAYGHSHGPGVLIGPRHTASAEQETPLGALSAKTWRRPWKGKRGARLAWAAEYTLNGAPITLREIRMAGLAKRPTTRRRRKNAQ